MQIKDISFFYREYPSEMNHWSIYMMSGIFVSLFTMIFQPFGMKYFESDYKLWIFSGYGVIVFCVLFLSLLIVKKMLPIWFSRDSWTAMKQIMYTTIVVTVVSLSLYVYSGFVGVIKQFGWLECIQFLWKTVAISLFPIIGTILLSQIIQLKKLNRAEGNNGHLYSEVVKESKALIASIYSHNGYQKLTIESSSLVYIESFGNYAKIGHYQNDQLVISSIRNTLKNIAIQLQHLPFIIQVHRSFLINIEHVKKAKGNSQRLRLYVKKSEIEIPVSRSLTKVVKEKLHNYRGCDS